MALQNNERVNWDLAKVDWDMVLRAASAKGQQAAQMHSADVNAASQENSAILQTNASMANAQTAAKTDMRGQDMTQQTAYRGQDVQSAGQNLDYAAKMAGVNVAARGQDLDYLARQHQTDAFTNVGMARAGLDTGLDTGLLSSLPPEQQALMSHQMDATHANAVLNGPNPQQAWQQYYGAMQTSGINPQQLGLSPVANAKAMLYMGNVMQRATQGINGLTSKDQSKVALDAVKSQQSMAEDRYKTDVGAIDKDKAANNNIQAMLPDVEAAKKALVDYHQNSPMGLGAPAWLNDSVNKVLEKSMDTPRSKIAASAGEMIDQYGARMKILQRSANAKAFSPTEMGILENLSIDKHKTLEENKSSLEGFQAYATRQLQYQQFKDAFTNATGTSQGADEQFQKYSQENPLLNPKTRQFVQPDPNTWKNYIPGYTANQVVQQPGQTPMDQSNAVSSANPMGNGQNPYA